MMMKMNSLSMNMEDKMEIFILFLTSTLLGAFFVGFFLLGYHIGKKQTKKDDKQVVIKNEEELKFLKELAEWSNYKG